MKVLKCFDLVGNYTKKVIGNKSNVEHRTLNIERPMQIALRFICFKDVNEACKALRQNEYQWVASIARTRLLRCVLFSIVLN